MWKTDREAKVRAGADGLVRNAVVRVAGQNRNMERPIQKLVRLPVE